MKRIIYLVYLWVCLVPALLSSCQDDRGDLSSSQPGSGVRVSFELPDYVQLGTRATSESALKDVTVLQYMNGTLAKKIVLEDRLFIQAVELTGLEPMIASTLDSDGKLVPGGENVLVFLANVKAVFGDTALDEFAEGASTYTALKDYTASFANAQALANAEFMPMTGFYYGGIADGVTNQINVTLTRSLAKINFTVNTDNFRYGGNAVAISVNTIELRNIPQELTFFPQNRPSLPAGGQPGDWGYSQTPYPAATGAGTAIGTDAAKFMSLTRDENQSSSVATNFVAYMPENARGSYPEITNNKSKLPKTGQQGWSYIYVDLDISYDGIVEKATYKIYLGGDDKGDINILAGTQYNVTTYLYGVNTLDTRITLSTIFDSTVTNGLTVDDLLQEPANSYIIQSGGSKYSGKDFIIPLSQAYYGWRHIKSSTNHTTDYVAQFDALIQSGAWEVVTLWKTWSGTVAITGTPKTTLTTVQSDSKQYFVSLDGDDLDGITAGNNCMIALQSTAADAYGNPAGTIWWTWHLWFTDYDPDAVTPLKGETHTYFSEAFTPSGLYYGKKMMDRNLGATIIGVDKIDRQPATNPTQYYGLLYQWGRKDPFTASGDGSNVMDKAVKIYDATGTQLTAGGGDGFPKVLAGEVLSTGVAYNRLVEAVRTPMNYYYGGGSSNDWTLQDNTLWNMTSKTAFDPCPPGWRVPAGGTTAAYNPWAGFGYGVSSNTNNNANYANTFGVNGPFPWFAAVTGQTGSAGRLYGANTTTGAGDFNWLTYGTPWSGGDVAWYPASGLRTQTSGAFNYSGTYGFYWQSAVAGVNGYYLDFNSTVVRPSHNNERARGLSVRCVQN